MRVAVGGISHETNSFSTSALGTTKLDAFSRGNALGAGPVLGDAVLATNVGVRSGIGGYIDTAPEIGADLVPLLFGSAAPSGTIADETYEYMRDELVKRLKGSMPVDAVALCLHGAGVAESYPDIEGDIGRAIREVVGPDVPLVSTWDLHGNISKECAETFDYMCCYQCEQLIHAPLCLFATLRDLVPMCLLVCHSTYPHVDGYERAQEAMRLLPRLMTGWRPSRFLEHVPTLLPLTMCCTMEGYPAHELLQYCQELENKPGVIDCTVFHGFPYADIDIVGTSVYVATEDSAELAEDIAKQVGAWIWRNRERFRLNVAGATGAVEAAVAALDDVDKPIVLNETADNTGCGAPGDSTHLLRAMIAASLPSGSACFSTIYDPEVARQAHAAGVGASIEVSLGGKLDPDMHGAPITGMATVRTLTDGEFKLVGPMNTNGVVRLGLCARLEISGVDVVVASERVQTLDIGSFALHGIDISAYKLVGLKSSTHFRAGMGPHASKIITADEPGLASGRLEVFESMRQHAPEAAHWPIVADAEYANEMVAVAAEELARL